MGITRLARYALDLARARGRRLTVATKSNAIVHTMPFWDEVVGEAAAAYPDGETRFTHIDTLAAYFVSRPHTFDVVVASNLFGDILTDVAAAVVGSIGIAPSANLNPERRFPSLFEPVHGSAPDIAGRGIANPIGQIWTAKMLLDFFGAADVAGLILPAVEAVLERGVRTPDLGGGGEHGGRRRRGPRRDAGAGVAWRRGRAATPVTGPRRATAAMIAGDGGGPAARHAAPSAGGRVGGGDGGGWADGAFSGTVDSGVQQGADEGSAAPVGLQLPQVPPAE